MEEHFNQHVSKLVIDKTFFSHPDHKLVDMYKVSESMRENM